MVFIVSIIHPTIAVTDTDDQVYVMGLREVSIYCHYSIGKHLIYNHINNL